MSNLKNVIYLSNEDYETLVSTGSVTIGGTTLTYDENNLYITPDKLATSTEDGLMSAADKSKIDGLDDSNLVHKTGTETISGEKTFSTGPILNTNVPLYGKTSSNTTTALLKIGAGNTITINPDNFGATYVGGGALCPTSEKSGLADLGLSVQKWRDLYLSGRLISYYQENDVSVSVGRLINQINSFSAGSSEWVGSDISTPGHLELYGDDDGNHPSKPINATGYSDPDTIIFNTGVFIYDSEDNNRSAQLSFPNKNGTFAIDEDLQLKQNLLEFNATIPEETETIPLTSIKDGDDYYVIDTECISFENALSMLMSSEAEIEENTLILPSDTEIEGSAFTTSSSMTIEGSTLII